jgi:hypothetical protein
LLNLNKYFLSQSKTDLSASVAEAIKDSALPKLAASFYFLLSAFSAALVSSFEQKWLLISIMLIVLHIYLHKIPLLVLIIFFTSF